MNRITDRIYDPQADNTPKHPGGTTTRIMWNEKVLLDNFVQGVANAPRGASLPSNHDAHKSGIYKTNSVGDFD